MVEEQYSRGRSDGFSVGDQPVIDERESVAEGFELLPQSDLLGGFEVIKAPESMAVRSSVRLLLRLSRISSAGERCSRVVAGESPSCMRPIVFEDAFDDKLFSQQNKEKQRSRTCARPPKANP